MNKLFSYAMVSAAALTLATSCSQEDIIPAEGDGNVSLAVQLPHNFDTRAFGDGENAQQLTYAVYQVEGEGDAATYKLVGTPDNSKTFSNLQTTVNLKLVNGKEYVVLFWAQNSGCDAFKPDWDSRSVSVNYDKLARNSENSDAFYATDRFTVSGAVNRTVTLYRPFAQLNIGTNDLNQASVEMAFGDNLTTTLSVADVYTEFDFITGEPTGTKTSVEYTATPVPADSETFPVEGYEYLSMDYLLVSSEQSDIINCTLSIMADGKEINTISIPNVPVQANYRTNIYGQLLTSETDFNVVIEPAFNLPENNIGPWDGTSLKEVKPVTKTINGVETPVYVASEPAHLAWIAKNMNDGVVPADIYIELDQDMDLGNKSWTPIANVSRKAADDAFSGTFDGKGHTIKNLSYSNTADNYSAGLFGVVNNGSISNTTIEGGNLKSIDSAGAIAGVMLGETTIENCSNNGVSVEADGAAGGIAGRAYGSKNIVSGCSNSADITSAEKAGGIVGIASAASSTTQINNCTNSGKITEGNAGIGGILGYAGSAVEINSCVNKGNVGTSDENYAGGMVGIVIGSATVTATGCTNSGKVIGNNAGGMQGAVGQYQLSNFNDCNNNGEIIAKVSAGGIIGTAGAGKIESCTNTAAVTATNADGVAGGIVGNDHRAAISACKGGAAAITAKFAGRIIGTTTSGANFNTTLNLINEGNSYENGLPTVGEVSHNTALAELIVESGTLVGVPAIGGNRTSYILIKENASWDAYPGETGMWRINNEGKWYKAN